MMTPELVNWTLHSIEENNHTFIPPMDLQADVQNIQALPPLPGIAAKIMQLAGDPYADAAKLAKIVEMDPLLTTQVIRWASSSLYGFRGKITSVKDAISSVLGYTFVFNLVLGLTALKPLQSPVEGVIGMRVFWEHALASTRLMMALNQRLGDHRFDEQTVFLVALMHNIGFPLLGDQFRSQFHYLTSLVEANPGLNRVKLEKFSLGASHCELGSWLLNTWEMPKEIVDVIYHHHNPHYRGDNHRLSLLTFTSDFLLAQINIGDGSTQHEIDDILSLLNLSIEDCNELMNGIEQEMESISSLVEICLAH